MLATIGPEERSKTKLSTHLTFRAPELDPATRR